MTYFLSKNWIVRKDNLLQNQYSLYSILNGESKTINSGTFSMLSLLEVETMNMHDLSKSLETINIKGVNKELIDSYIKQGIIEEGSKNHLEQANEYLSYIAQNEQFQNSELPISATPKTIELHLTQQCNLRCDYCAYDVSTAKSQTLDYTIWKALFNELEENKVQLLILSGGEPFLYKDIDYILEDLKDRKFKVNIFTNGTLIKRKHIEALSSPNITVSISLDASKSEIHEAFRGTNTFNKVMESIKLLSENNVRFYISSTLHKLNKNEIWELVNISKLYKAESIAFSKALPLGRASDKSWILSAEEEKEVEKQIEKCKQEDPTCKIDFTNDVFYNDSIENTDDLVYCSAGTHRLTINADGNIYPCVLNFDDENFIVGNIANSSLIDLWKNGRWYLVRDKVRIDDIKACNTCNFAKKCLLKSCRLSAYYDKTDFLAKPPMCNIM